MNLMIQPNQICLIVKLYNNRPELLPDSNDKNYSFMEENNNLNRLKVNVKDYLLSSELRISSISLGVTTLLTAGKCFVFPVTR